MRGLAVLVAGVGIIAIAGCGGGDDRLSKDEFLAQGNALLCASGAEVQAENDRMFGAATGEPTDEQLRSLTTFIVTRDKETAGAIAELRPPKDLAASVQTLVADFQAGLDEFGTRMQADPQDIDAIEADVFTPIRARFVALGLDKQERHQCGK